MPKTEEAVMGLNGHEVIADLLYQIEQKLKRDCNLTQMCCYEGGYSAEANVKIKLHGIDIETVDLNLRVGVENDRPGLTAEAAVKIPIDERLNVVRERSKQPIPTMIKDETTGELVVKQRRYERVKPHAVNEPVQSDGGATGDQLETE